MLRRPARVALAIVPALLLGLLVGVTPAQAAQLPGASWGSDSSARLGSGFGAYAATPVAVSTGQRPAQQPFAQVVAGWRNACGLTAAGAAYCWGAGNFGTLGNGTTTDALTPVAVSSGARTAEDTFISLAVGSASACGLTSAGEAFCWGRNLYGQLGNGTTADSTVPVAVTGGLAFRSISAENANVCGVATDDSIYCWGENLYGQLGNGTTSQGATSAPVRVVDGAIPAGTVMASVSVGPSNACALTQAGAAYCWGQGGALGNNDMQNSSVPVQVVGGRTFRSLSAGSSSQFRGATCGITLDDSAYCWGDGQGGVLGNGSNSWQTAPVAVNTSGVLSGVRLASVSVGLDSACALSIAGALSCWGSNMYGQLGTGTASFNPSSVPVAVLPGARPGGQTWTSVTGGGDFACALSSGQSAYCWGSRGGNTGGGYLGDGTASQYSTPIWMARGAVPSGQLFTSIGTGQETACGVAAGWVYCWGRGSEGQLGNGQSGVDVQALAPTAVSHGEAPSPSTYTGVAVGSRASCAWTDAGGAYCWGIGNNGQLGNGTQSNSSVPKAVVNGDKPAGATWSTITMGNEHACGIATDDSAYCWGSAQSGALGTGINSGNYPYPMLVRGGVSWKAVSAGWGTTCGIALDDSAYCWGGNASGQMGNGTQTDDSVPVLVSRQNLQAGEVFTVLSVGMGFTCGVTSAGRILCWGFNGNGQLGTGNTSQSSVPRPVNSNQTFTRVSAGQMFACAVAVTSQAYCWGVNGNGQLGDGTLNQQNSPALVVGVGDGPATFTDVKVGTESVVAIPTPATAPGAPTLTSASATPWAATIAFSPGPSNGDIPDNYQYQLDGGAWSTLSPAQASSPITIGGLAPDTTYAVRLRAVNSAGPGAASGAVSVTTLPDPNPPPPAPPSAPTSVTAEAGDRSAVVSWRAPASSGAFAISSYQVSASPGGASCLTAAMTCEMAGLANGTAYTFRVQALSGAGWGAWSEPSAPVTPSAREQVAIVISGARSARAISISGTTTGVGMGGMVTPWSRKSGGAYQAGRDVLVDAEGTFTWSRKVRGNATWSVYVTAGAAKSNTVVLKR